MQIRLIFITISFSHHIIKVVVLYECPTTVIYPMMYMYLTFPMGELLWRGHNPFLSESPCYSWLLKAVWYFDSWSDRDKYRICKAPCKSHQAQWITSSLQRIGHLLSRFVNREVRNTSLACRFHITERIQKQKTVNYKTKQRRQGLLKRGWRVTNWLF